MSTCRIPPVVLMIGFLAATSGEQARTYAQSPPMTAKTLVHSPYVPEDYELFHNDEFDGSATLDTSKWYPAFLPHWSDSSHIAYAQTRYVIENGVLKLRTLQSEHTTWSPWDPNIKSAVMSGEYAGSAGSKFGLHEFGGCRANPSCQVWSGQSDQFEKLAVTKYGYFEIRAKACPTAYCAWWMIGFEDDPTRSGEIDVFEFNHNKWLDPSDGITKCAHFGIHRWDDPNLAGENYFHDTNCSYANQWHVYGLLWTEESVTLFIDGQQIKTIDESPDYEMVTILDASNGNGHASLPTGVRNQFEIDYFRIYKNRRVDDSTATMLGGTPGWGHVAAHAVDGVPSTYAQSYTENWDLEVDLQGLYAVEKVIYWPLVHWATHYTIQVKGATGVWATVATVTNGTYNKHTHVFSPPVSARYVRMDVTQENASGDYAHAMRELSVYGIPNVGGQRPATMLNGSPGWGHVPGRAVDETTTLYAQSYTENWDLEVELADEASIQRIVYRPNWANWAKDYTIQVKREAGDWETVALVTGNGSGVRTHVFDPPVKARYVRFEVSAENTSGDYAHAIHELEIYGVPE